MTGKASQVSAPGDSPIARVAVIGAGAVGRSFAVACLKAGYEVVLEDVMPSNLRRAEAELQDLSGWEGRHLLTLVSTVEDAVRTADIAVDFVPDELESKLEIFSLIDRMAPPKTILCMPTTTLSITDLASCTYRAERCVAVRGELGAPGPLCVVHAARVDHAVLSRVEEFFTRLGHEVTAEEDRDTPMLVKNLAGRF